MRFRCLYSLSIPFAVMALLSNLRVCNAQLTEVETNNKENVYTMEEGAIQFVAPIGFKPLSKKLLETKWPTNSSPRFAVGNERATTTVAYDLKPHSATQDKLPELLKTFEQLFPRVIPGLKWKSKEIRKIGDRKWIYIEMTSNAVDTDIYNIMMATGYKDQMLVFNFNSTREDFPKYEEELRKSIKSIEINEQ